MDIRKVKKLIELIEETNITELEIKEGEESIKISRGARVAAAPEIISPAQATPIVTQDIVATEQAKEPAPSGHVVKSPMVGTYYQAPSPDSASFVEIGQSIKAGEVLCIIEAMKMMNQVESDVSGTVQAIHIENGQPVEFDQPLFTIS